MRFAGIGIAALLAASCAAQAQPAAKNLRVGHLGHGLDPALIQVFRASMQDLGYIEGRNLAFAYRYAEGSAEQLPRLAAELAASNLDVIVANGTPAARAAQRAAGSVPVVMVGIGGDPVQLGLIRSLSRPDGNLTGIAALGTALWGKRLELFREAFPKVSKLAVLSNPTNPGNVLALKEITAVAPQNGMKLQAFAARDAKELAKVLDEIAAQGADGMVVIWDAFLLRHGKRIADFAIKERLPALAAVKEYVEDGALMSYAANVPEQWRRAAYYVDKIAKGARAADLPVEQPTKFDLVINLRTVKALGMRLPQPLLLRADQLIE